MEHTRYLRLLAGFTLLAVVAGGLYQSGVTAHFSPSEIDAMVRPYGMLAPFMFVVLYIVATVLVLPATPLTVAAGALFGLWWGTVYVVLGATVGAVTAFLYARFLSAGWSREQQSGFGARLAAYEAELEAHGFVTVLVLRLLPIVPFNIINFALGLTRIRLRSYALATFIGIIPGTMAYVYFGHSLRMLTWQSILTAAAILLGLTVAGWYGKRAVTRRSLSADD